MMLKQASLPMPRSEEERRKNKEKRRKKDS